MAGLNTGNYLKISYGAVVGLALLLSLMFVAYFADFHDKSLPSTSTVVAPGLALLKYANKHNGAFPLGKTSTEVFQQLIDDKSDKGDRHAEALNFAHELPVSAPCLSPFSQDTGESNVSTASPLSNMDASVSNASSLVQGPNWQSVPNSHGGNTTSSQEPIPGSNFDIKVYVDDNNNGGKNTGAVSNNTNSVAHWIDAIEDILGLNANAQNARAFLAQHHKGCK